jgi:hypothetical protein
MQQGQGYLERPAPSGLADVVDTVLAKGIVLDAYARVSVIGIELLTIDARIAIASVDTYLRLAEATNRLDLYERGGRTLPEIFDEGAGAVIEMVASTVVERKVDHARDRIGDTMGEPVEKTARVAERKVVETAEEVATRAADAIERARSSGIARRLPPMLGPRT